MSGNVLALAARQALRILLWQLGWVAALAVICAALFGARAGGSLLAGGGIGLIWTIYMAATLYRHSLDFGVRMSALSFVAGWLIKTALTMGLLVVALSAGVFAAPPLLGGLFGALLAYWAWLALGLSRRGW